MTRNIFAIFLKTGSMALLLFVLLFAGGTLESSSNFTGAALREMAVVLRDSESQWMVFLCLGIYFTAFLFIRSRVENSFTQRCKGSKEILWLGYKIELV